MIRSKMTVRFLVLTATLRAVGVPGTSVGATSLIVRVVVALIKSGVGTLETLLS